MKSASLTARGSGQQREGKAIPDDESGMQVEDKPEIDNEERAEPPRVSSTNIRRRIAVKSEPRAVTTQDAVDGFREKAMKIESVEQIELGSIMELSITGQVLRWARQSNLSGEASLRKPDGWNMKNRSRLTVRAGEKDPGAITLVLWLKRLFVLVFHSCGPGRRMKILRVLCGGTSSIRGGSNLRDVWRSRCKPSRPSSLGKSGATPPSYSVARRAEQSDEGVSATKVEGFRGRHHSRHGRVRQGVGRHSREGFEIIKNQQSGREGSEVVDHGGRKKREAR